MKLLVRALAICIALVISVALPASAAGETSASLDRLLAAATDYGVVSDEGVAELRRVCGEDPLCAAQNIVAADGGRARLVQVSHPDSDTIRWVTGEPSVTEARWLPNGARLVVLEGFGRKVVEELLAALADKKASEVLVVDLRANSGGDFGRMLEVAGVLIPKTKNALYIIDKKAKMALDVTPQAGRDGGLRGGLLVLVGPATASSGEVLAALLRRYASARILGEPTAGKNFLYRVVPVDDDWRLLLPAETVVVPGETIAGGLVPNGKIPSSLASQIPAEAKEEAAH